MLSTNVKVIQQTVQWIHNGQQVFLVTLVRANGSSPRPVGSIMAITQEGRSVGSISNGCVESALIDQIKELSRLDYPEIIIYGNNRDELDRLMLPCGATIELVIEKLDSNNKLSSILENIMAGQCVTRYLNIASGESYLRISDHIHQLEYKNGTIKRGFGPGWRLILIGADEISYYISTIAGALEFHTTVCDPREDYVGKWENSDISPDTRMPDDLVRSLPAKQYCAIITLTHDPKLDDLALLEALPSDAFYVGSLGSRATHKKRQARLLSLGITQQQLNKLHAPVGLSIGSKAPAEIAISILAELVAVRNTFFSHASLSVTA